MKKILFVSQLFAACLLLQAPLFSQEVKKDKNKEVKSKEDSKARMTDKYLELINAPGNQPESVMEIGAELFSVLSKSRNASFFDLTRDDKFVSLCRDNNMLCTGGPMLGGISYAGVNVWVRTLLPGKVEVSVDADGKTVRFGPVATSADGDLRAVVPVTGMKPGKEYPYKVFVDGKDAFPGRKFTFRTVPDGKSDVTVAFGADFHKRGASNMKQVDQILAHKPYAMLFGGDNCAGDRDNNLGMHRADYFARDMFPAWQKLSAAVPVYAQWDDHDYFNNDKSGIPPGYTDQDRRSVRKVFLENWNNPSAGLSEQGGGIFFTTNVGLIDYIVIDQRYFRDPEKGQYLGPEQTKWLYKALKESKAPFKILSGGSMWNDAVGKGKDSWLTFAPEERENLFDYIEKENITGVVLVSGDRHGARVFTVPRPSGFKFYEFNVGSLGGRGKDDRKDNGHKATDPSWTDQLYGISNIYAFGLFTASVSGPEPTLTYRLIDENGNQLYRLAMPVSMLTPRKIRFNHTLPPGQTN